ncbi:MAG: hypothetical protein BTN85_0779 [Candidatus Methanohalarchaeum thermophilum]|uniref:Uncharacterized protein n=1 Tax=Methanohalarchaeum thermophilum TaxID=1903181 RepID=A0A1Q6DV87_METT1|nr:MAG: hypothetical protein BTN85_0779 [Candidatus Methanohalarchaeum thermophilum]
MVKKLFTRSGRSYSSGSWEIEKIRKVKDGFLVEYSNEHVKESSFIPGEQVARVDYLDKEEQRNLVKIDP